MTVLDVAVNKHQHRDKRVRVRAEVNGNTFSVKRVIKQV